MSELSVVLIYLFIFGQVLAVVTQFMSRKVHIVLKIISTVAIISATIIGILIYIAFWRSQWGI